VDAICITKLPDGSIVNGGAGVENSETDSPYPAVRDSIRGYNHAGSGWHFIPLASGGTRIAYVIQSDLKGWFLPVVINSAIAGSYAAFFEDLNRALAAKLPR